MADTNPPDGLPARLTEACSERSLSAPQLAHAAQISQATAYRYLSGRERPQSWAALTRMAHALGVTVDWLLTGEGPRHRPLPESDGGDFPR